MSSLTVLSYHYSNFISFRWSFWIYQSKIAGQTMKALPMELTPHKIMLPWVSQKFFIELSKEQVQPIFYVGTNLLVIYENGGCKYEYWSKASNMHSQNLETSRESLLLKRLRFTSFGTTADRINSWTERKSILGSAFWNWSFRYYASQSSGY